MLFTQANLSFGFFLFISASTFVARRYHSGMFLSSSAWPRRLGTLTKPSIAWASHWMTAPYGSSPFHYNIITQALLDFVNTQYDHMSCWQSFTYALECPFHLALLGE